MPHLAQLIPRRQAGRQTDRHVHAAVMVCATAEECIAGNGREAGGLGGTHIHLWTQSCRIKSDVWKQAVPHRGHGVMGRGRKFSFLAMLKGQCVGG